MKKYIKIVFVAILFISVTSCLKYGLEDLPEFDLKDITGIQRVEYRFVSDEISPVDGERIVKFVSLGKIATINEEAATVSIDVSVPAASATFPETERANCSQSNIAVMVSVSTAARISPIGEAPLFGVPGDWTKANKYVVTAADGSQKEWTVEISSFTK
jgi:hypothetical protein